MRYMSGTPEVFDSIFLYLSAIMQFIYFINADSFWLTLHQSPACTSYNDL